MKLDMQHWLVSLIYGVVTLILFASGVPVTAKSAQAQTLSPLIGVPPVQKIAQDAEFHPLNFAVTQDAQGILYVANMQGVLEHDGRLWQLHRMPNRESVRALSVMPDGRVLVGGYNLFGYLQRDATGIHRFVDLSVRFGQALKGRAFADVWEILQTPEGMYFRSLNDLFLWNPKTNAIAHWYAEQKFGAVFRFKGTTIVQYRERGLHALVGEPSGRSDDWQAITGTGEAKQLISFALPLNEDANGAMLLGGAQGIWFRLDDSGLLPIRMPERFPSASEFESGLRLADGRYAFGSTSGSMYIVDNDRKQFFDFKLDPGFLSGLHASRSGGLWAVGDRGLYHVQWPSEWSVLDQSNGLSGTILRLTSINGVRYVCTSSGVFVAKQTGAALTKFERAKLPSEWTNDVLGLEDGRILIAHTHYLRVSQNERVEKVVEQIVYPRSFERSKFRNDRVFVLAEDGLYFVDTAKITSKASAGLLWKTIKTETGFLPTSVVEASERELWVGTERHGLWRFVLTDDGRVQSQVQYGDGDGITLGTVKTARVSMVRGKLYVATYAGLFEQDGGYDSERFKPTDLFGLAALRREEELLLLREIGNDVWALGVTRVILKSGDKPWRTIDTRSLVLGVLSDVEPSGAGDVSVIADNGILSRNAEVLAKANPISLRLRAVTYSLADSAQSLPLNVNAPLRFAQVPFSIKFEFALPAFDAGVKPRYRGRMLGVETQMSSWDDLGRYTYSDLTPGYYEMQIESIDGYGNVSAIKPYGFYVDAPWWWSDVAKMLYIALALALIWAAMRWSANRRVTRLQREKTALESKVAERTEELAKANEQLQALANQDGLTGLANRRRLDAYLASSWQKCIDLQRPLAVLVIDVDYFKQINDTHGHLIGDEMLRRIAQVLADSLRRRDDLLARSGGEEFVAVLPGGNQAHALTLAQGMRLAVEKMAAMKSGDMLSDQRIGRGKSVVAADDSTLIRTTISVGVCVTRPSPEGNVATLLAAADAALYTAKNAGRNRVEIAAASDANAEP